MANNPITLLLILQFEKAPMYHRIVEKEFNEFHEVSFALMYL